MNRILAAFALALSIASTSAGALAAPNKPAPAARHEKGDKDKKFPMKGDEFKRVVSERVGKARERMEKHITRSKASDDKAKEIRARFDATIAKINKKTEEVTADGSVTKEEAKEVFTLFRELGGHHGGKRPDKKKLAEHRAARGPGSRPSVSPSGGVGKRRSWGGMCVGYQRNFG